MYRDLVQAAKILSELCSGRKIDTLFDLFLKEENNKNFIKDIVYGSIRDFYLNDYILKKFVKRDIKDHLIKYLLMNTIYQINHQSKTEFTVVNEAVKAAKKINNNFYNLVNAVLRNYLREKNKFVTPDEMDIRYSYPQWWVSNLMKEYPNDYEAILAIGNTRATTVIRINKRQISFNDYIDLLEQANIDYELILDEQYIQINDVKDITMLPGYERGHFYVQDPAAQLVCNFLDIQNGMNILDLCSAPGGKATHILERFDVDLDCYDISKERINLIRSNMKRLQLKANIIDKIEINKRYDRILIDAPCSGSGVVRRNIDIKLMRKQKDIEKFSNQQLQLLEEGWKILKSGGKLLYVTCSIFKNENENIVMKFLSKNKDAASQDLKIPNGFKHKNTQLIPNQFHDGLYFKIFSKN
jgi:16S rRNA (cytosine967-C5)-methyltransferase